MFIPMNIMEQFHRVANCYFLILALVSCAPFSPTVQHDFTFVCVTPPVFQDPSTQFAPLFVVLMFQVLQCACDLRRLDHHHAVQLGVIVSVDSTSPGHQCTRTQYNLVRCPCTAIHDLILKDVPHGVNCELLVALSRTESHQLWACTHCRLLP